MRYSPAISVVDGLLIEGAIVSVTDPKALDNFSAIFDDKIEYFEDEFKALEDADCMIIMTEWNEYRNIDLERVKKAMKGNFIMDTRDVLNIDDVLSAGFIYSGTGIRKISPVE